MSIVVIILAILYLCGCKVGTGLAICAIIEATLSFILAILHKVSKG